jgi:hypothetical protein
MPTMLECPISHPALPTLYDPQVPNNPTLWAAFHGRLRGLALVDDLLIPTQCRVRTEARLTYASRWMSQSFLA